MSNITSFPLAWPDNVARTLPYMRSHPKFQERTVAAAVSMVLAEINRLNGRRWDYVDDSVVISSNIKPKLGGLPSGNAPEPADSGVAVYFKLRFHINHRWHERPCVMTCDRWVKTYDNLAAIAKDIEAQRARERWGCTNIEQAFRGYLAIPEKCGGKSWWDTLGVPPDASLETIKDAYKKHAKTAHPDVGGNRDEWDKIQRAFDEAQARFR